MADRLRRQGQGCLGTQGMRAGAEVIRTLLFSRHLNPAELPDPLTRIGMLSVPDVAWVCDPIEPCPTCGCTLNMVHAQKVGNLWIKPLQGGEEGPHRAAMGMVRWVATRPC